MVWVAFSLPSCWTSHTKKANRPAIIMRKITSRSRIRHMQQLADRRQGLCPRCVVLGGVAAHADPDRLDGERCAERALLVDEVLHRRAERLADNALDADEVFAVLSEDQGMLLGRSGELVGEDRAVEICARLAPRPVGEQIAGTLEAIEEGNGSLAERCRAIARRRELDVGAEQASCGISLRQQAPCARKGCAVRQALSAPAATAGDGTKWCRRGAGGPSGAGPPVAVRGL